MSGFSFPAHAKFASKPVRVDSLLVDSLLEERGCEPGLVLELAEKGLQEHVISGVDFSGLAG